MRGYSDWTESTDDAGREILAFGKAAAARMGERIRHAQAVGRHESQRIGLVKNLGDIEPGIFEIDEWLRNNEERLP